MGFYKQQVVVGLGYFHMDTYKELINGCVPVAKAGTTMFR